MNTDKEKKLSEVKKFLDKNNVFYSEKANGQLQIDGINLWTTTEKFYDTNTGAKGEGINNFMKYLRKNKKRKV